MFSYSQDDWESNLNLTYPLFKLNGQRTSRLHVKLLYRGALAICHHLVVFNSVENLGFFKT